MFVEETSHNMPRKSQIKLRLKQSSETKTKKDVELLILNSKKCSNLTYKYGTTRGNYVSADKRFKTTVFGQDKANIKFILEKVLSVISESFNEELLSLTIMGARRPSIHKRTKRLHNVDVNTVNFNENVFLKLKSINLLINGVTRIIKL